MANRRGKIEAVIDYFLGFQNHCGCWLQPWNEKTLASRKESYDKLRQHIKKQRHHFADKSPYSQSYGFSSRHVWIESRTIKKPELRRTDAFKLLHCRRFFRIPWTTRRSNQSILKVINPEYSLEGLMLKHQFFGYLMQKAHLLEKTLILGKIEDKRRRGQQRMRCLDSITYSMDVILSKLRR